MLFVNLRTMYTIDKDILKPLLSMNGNYISLPDGAHAVNPVDWSALVRELVAQLGDLPLVYSDNKYMKLCVNDWCNLNRKRWNETIRTLCFDYDPISNYNRTEQWEDNTVKKNETVNSGIVGTVENGKIINDYNSRTNSTSNSVASTSGDSVTVSEENGTSTTNSASSSTAKENSTATTVTTVNGTVSGNNSNSETNTEKTAGYNVDSMSVKGVNEIERSETTSNESSSESNVDASSNKSGETSSESSVDGSVNKSGTTSNETSGNSSTNESGEIVSAISEESNVNRNVQTSDETTVNTSGNVDTVRTGRVHGNIGVTTTQEMIESERKLLSFRFYQLVIDEFKERFLILVY